MAQFILNVRKFLLNELRNLILIVLIIVNGRNFKLKHHSFEQVPHIPNVVALYALDDDYLLIFDKEPELTAFLFWMSKEPILSEIREEQD